jgi:hypothetical protein
VEKINQKEWLYLVPVCNERVKTSEEEGGVVLLVPMDSPLDFLARHLHGEYRKLRLDDYGGFAWSLCDGKRSVSEIGARIKERWGEGAEPLYERLLTFFLDLRRRNLLDFKAPTEE